MQQPKIVKDLYKSKNPFEILTNLKTLSYEIASKKIKQTQKHPIANKVLFQSTSLPNDYSNLRSSRQLSFSNNLEGEIAWFVNSLSKYKNEINLFIQLEEEFQKKVLLSQFEDALKFIEVINTQVCYSYWAIENKFSIEQRHNGPEGNWNFLNELNKSSRISYTLFFNNYFSVKSETEVSILQYRRYLEGIINSAISPSDLEYIIFKLGYFYIDDYNEYAYFLFSENLSSIIDKYLLLIDVLVELSKIPHKSTLVTQILDELSEFGIQDQRIDRLKEYYMSNEFLGLNQEILNLFDIYTVGNYSQTIRLSVQLLKIYPYAFEIYETYIQSLLELNEGFKKTDVSPYIDFILEKLYSLFKKDNNYEESKESLLKEYLCFPRLMFFKQLLSFTLGLTRIKNSKANGATYFVNSKFSNPQLIFWNDIKDKIEFNQKDYEEHISIRINSAISKKDYYGLDNENIPSTKLKIYKTRIGYYYDDEVQIKLLEDLYKDENLNPYYQEQNTLFLFKAYLESQNYDSLIQLLVNSFFRNKFLLDRLDKLQIINYFIDINYEIKKITIDLPILFYIEDMDSYYLFVTLELFLTSIDVSKPSEIEFINEKDKLIFLLNKVCTIDVLNYFYLIYENDDDVIKERIDILKNLAKFDRDNQKSYFDEIAFLTQRQRIKHVIKRVNDGKISLNFSRIKEDKKINLENSFNRFLRIKGFTDKNELLLFDSHDLLKSFLSEIEGDYERFQEASYINFKALFIELTDHFLFSKEHGLEGDLSTRIRHGVIENQLRMVFKPLNLISTKKSENEYNNIVFWDELCDEKSYMPDIKNSIQKILKNFSESIDTLILKIVKEFIQIQSNNHHSKLNALFNYRFSDEYLYLMFKEVSSVVNNYEDFLSYVFEILTIHTKKLLKDVRRIFKSEINHQFQQLLNNLESKLKLVINRGEVWSELNQNINLARTQIERELHNVSNWFKITNEIHEGALDMDTIVKTAFESINIYYSENEKLKPEISDPIKGFLFEKGLYYIDIFRILIDNAIEHSKLNMNELKIKVVIENKIIKKEFEDNGYSELIINFQNNLCDSIDLNNLNERLDNVVVNWNSDLSKVNTEGGSGLHKIKRLIKYDILAMDSSFNYKLVKNLIKLELKIKNIYNYK